ncbi:unnamed protein product [Urochloa humidicola]
MKVKLQACQMWEADKYGGVARHEDRRALEALVAAVPSELGAILATGCFVGNRLGTPWQRACATVFSPEIVERVGSLGFPTGMDVDDFALRLSNLM